MSETSQSSRLPASVIRFPLQADGERRRVPESVLASAAAFLGALAFALAGPYTNFADANYIDTWIYTGYFTNFSYLLRHYGLTYYVSRLPWILRRGCPAIPRGSSLTQACRSRDRSCLVWASPWNPTGHGN